MTLIITAVAAVIATIIRFAKPEFAAKAYVGLLALMYWGASIMWCVDGIASLVEGEPFVELSGTAAMSDDALLGICVVALGLVVWAIVLFVKRGIARKTTAQE
jgi:hypothetical protein